MPRICRAPGCKSAIADTHYYCRSDFEKLEDGLLKTVDRIYPDAADIYLGRTHYPEQRLLQHRVNRDLDHLAVLHWAGDQEEIEWLEERLISECRDRCKRANISGDSEGRWSGHFNCVYVAWRWKARAKPWSTSFVNVTDLDMGHRIWPERGALVKRPHWLRTKLSARGAERVLDLFGARW